ncbi:Mitochondrial substrate carrier family protein [Prunus dulcis]|uniref:Mitochondrial substrate carrier family protein n=1 Tax=Prunus dulcis TaxID=3755 RepID=A0A4Y1RYT6_PRUDU|nr:Mitochondrial substrate carrier family protein [Prunus dulcis]
MVKLDEEARWYTYKNMRCILIWQVIFVLAAMVGGLEQLQHSKITRDYLSPFSTRASVTPPKEVFLVDQY